MRRCIWCNSDDVRTYAEWYNRHWFGDYCYVIENESLAYCDDCASRCEQVVNWYSGKHFGTDLTLKEVFKMLSGEAR